MPVFFKSKGLQLLTKVGVHSELVCKLKAKGVKLVLGPSTFSFMSPDDFTLATGTLPASSGDLLAGNVQFGIKNQALNVLASTATMALLTLAGELPPVPVAPASSPVASVMPDSVKIDPATVLEVPVFPGNPPVPPMAVGEVIPLREATTLYQQVRGTSAGSVYVVVALGQGLALAARIHGHSLAIRAEPTQTAGVFGLEQADKLKSQGLDHKGHYASAHFECQKVEPGRVLGAVLIGLGIPFFTPVPDIALVAAKSK